MDWKNISGGVVEGLTTALAWAIFLWAWQKAKAHRIRVELRRSLADRQTVHWQRPNLFGLTLRNGSAWPVTVRGVGFLLDSGAEVKCKYLGRKKSEYDDHILLKPRTSDSWGCPQDVLRTAITVVWIEYEYDTFLGRNAVEKVEFVGASARFFEDARRSIANPRTGD